MAIIVIFIYIKKTIFTEILLNTKSKKSNPVYVQIFYAQILRALLSNKMQFAFLKKSIVKYLKYCVQIYWITTEKIKFCLVQYTVEWLNFVVHYLNVKIN